MKKTYKYRKRYVLNVTVIYIISILVIVGIYLFWRSASESNLENFVAFMIFLTVIFTLTEINSNMKYILEVDENTISHLIFYYIFFLQKKQNLIVDWKDIYSIKYIKKYFLFGRLFLFSTRGIVELKINGIENSQDLVKEILERTKDNEKLSVDERVLALIAENKNT